MSYDSIDTLAGIAEGYHAAANLAREHNNPELALKLYEKAEEEYLEVAAQAKERMEAYAQMAKVVRMQIRDTRKGMQS